jgi:hypothetical protein
MPLSDVELSVALTSARTYLNDDAASVWSDNALIPKAQEAHRELQTMLWGCGSPAVRAVSSPITVAANTTDMTSQLPADLMTPFKLEEFAATVETYANAVPMTEKFYLPPVAPNGSTLGYWSWQQETLLLIGCTANRKVVISYRREIPIPQLTTDSIGILFGELYIGARTAAIAHGSLGNTDAYNIATATAKANFQLVVQAQRGQQTPPVKP